jgi:hypothetical protein
MCNRRPQNSSSDLRRSAAIAISDTCESASTVRRERFKDVSGSLKLSQLFRTTSDNSIRFECEFPRTTRKTGRAQLVGATLAWSRPDTDSVAERSAARVVNSQELGADTCDVVLKIRPRGEGPKMVLNGFRRVYLCYACIKGCIDFWRLDCSLLCFGLRGCKVTSTPKDGRNFPVTDGWPVTRPEPASRLLVVCRSLAGGAVRSRRLG